MHPSHTDETGITGWRATSTPRQHKVRIRVQVFYEGRTFTNNCDVARWAVFGGGILLISVVLRWIRDAVCFFLCHPFLLLQLSKSPQGLRRPCWLNNWPGTNFSKLQLLLQTTTTTTTHFQLPLRSAAHQCGRGGMSAASSASFNHKLYIKMDVASSLVSKVYPKYSRYVRCHPVILESDSA